MLPELQGRLPSRCSPRYLPGTTVYCADPARPAHLRRTIYTDQGMIPPDPQARHDAKTKVLDGLARLRVLFPLEQRLHAAPEPVRAAYIQVLEHWRRATPPAPSAVDAAMLTALVELDAVVMEEQGLGCYPFCTADTGIHVALSGGTVNAMCAIDALAIARLVRVRTRIDAACTNCAASIVFHVEENGGLDHDQADSAHVVWRHMATTHASCSQGLCRHIRFLCPACPAPETGEHFTLPQAAAVGNAFFRFQSALLAVHAGQAV